MSTTGRKLHPVNVAYESRAKSLLKAELKRRDVSYAGLAKRLSRPGLKESERNLSNKISRGGFSAAFLLQCLDAIGCASVRIRDDD